MLHAAVFNGANAVYIGMPGFNARGRSADFTFDDLREMTDFAHLYGVRVYLAFNVLVFPSELSEVIDLVYKSLDIGVDAFIVQDIGLVQLIREISPTIRVHASTQMTITNHEAIELLSDLQINRFVLGRENSINEIKVIRENTDEELEVFVHGALCVAYSGQCLTSESFGGRSANRGQCAQSCRMPYDLIVDGEQKDMGAKRYLVSPQDLNGLGDLHRLNDLNLQSFKIEGRVKSAEYVAAATSAYRKRLDEILERKATVAKRLNTAIDSTALGLTFARGDFNGWFEGVNHQKLVDPLIHGHTGHFLGTLEGFGKARKVPFLLVQTSASIEKGEGIRIDGASETGGRVFNVERNDEDILRLEMSFDFSIDTLKKGARVYKTDSPALDRIVRASFENKDAGRLLPINVTVRASLNQHLEVDVVDAGRLFHFKSESVLQPSRTAPLDQAMLKTELGALTETPFWLKEFDYYGNGDFFLHQRELKTIRRNMVETLKSARLSQYHVEDNARKSKSIVKEFLAVESLRKSTEAKPIDKYPGAGHRLHALLRDKGQLSSLHNLQIDTVYLDFEYGKDCKQSVEQIRELGYRVGLSTTRILKPMEHWHLDQIVKLNPDVILVRNIGALHVLQGVPAELVGDFSLNVSNSLSLNYFLRKGLSRICPSYDLNASQLNDLLKSISGGTAEITVHQYIPAFHMEHCVYAAFLSKGTSFKDCGRPCDTHRVELRDHTGALHPLKPDMECRNTMFNGKSQSAAKLIPDLLDLGVRDFRVEALFESPEQVRTKIKVYSQLIERNLDPREAFALLGSHEQYGIGEGQLRKDAIYLDKKKTKVSPR